MRTKAYPCRFPGCEWSARAAAPRGRHESQSHGMKKGVAVPSLKEQIADAVQENRLLDDELKIGPTSNAPFRLPVSVHAATDGMFNEFFKAATTGDPPTPNGHMSPADHVRAALKDMLVDLAGVTARCRVGPRGSGPACIAWKELNK